MIEYSELGESYPGRIRVGSYGIRKKDVKSLYSSKIEFP
jgi:hypothetical protein